MTKRTIVIGGLLVLLALSFLGAQVVGPAALAVAPAGDSITVIDDLPGVMQASREPVCPPAVPPPCGGG